MAARRRHARAEHQLVTPGRRGPARAAGRLHLRQCLVPEVELDVADANRRTVLELGVIDALAVDLGAVAARVFGDGPLALLRLDVRVLARHRRVQYREIDPWVASELRAIHDAVCDAPGIDKRGDRGLHSREDLL